MGRTFANNTANYLSRASCILGLNGLTACSVGFWLRLTATTGANQRIVDHESGGQAGAPFRLQYNNTGTLAFALCNSGATMTPDWTVTAPAFGAWTRVLFTYQASAFDQTDATIYYNAASQTIAGFAASGYAAGFTLLDSSGNLFYGLRTVLNTLPLNGDLSWMTVWNRKLTVQEANLDWQHPKNVLSGLLQRVQLCPDTDDSAAGLNMTLNGTVNCLQGPREETTMWIAT